MTDTFQKFAPGLESPATRIAEITPNDATDIPHASRAVNVATSGALRVTTLGGDIGTVHVVAGLALPLRVVRVWETGTTATGIVVMF
jgi:hypothetical protein